jgi:RNA polymerase sigma-70 factor (ECF subfamily)
MAGDRCAEESLVQRYQRGVSIIVGQAVRGRPIADDICQDTFRITLQKIRQGDIREPDRLSAFIWSVARNLVTDYFRKVNAHPDVDLDTVYHLSDPAVGPEEELLKKEQAELARRLLAEMKSERDREVLYRFYIAEDDKKRICHDLGLTSLQFNLVLFRARAHYRKLFEQRAGRG